MIDGEAGGREAPSAAAPAGGPAAQRGLGRALGLTAASTLVWGIAHVRAGRRAAGYSLMALSGLLTAGTAAAVPAFSGRLRQVVLRHDWLDAITAGVLLLALVWAVVIIRSYQVVRPAGLRPATRLTAGSLVTATALLVCAPLVYVANTAYVLRTTLSTIFPGEGRTGRAIDAANPWKDLPRLNLLLLGGDGGRDRTGVRTDSMTVASVDTRTGATVVIGLPRSLQRFEMPPRLRERWPDGYTGDPGDEGLLNELYLLGERHPELTPGEGPGRRGPRLIEEVAGYLLGLRIDYYVLVNLGGFREIVDAMGGVRVHVEKRLPIGGEPERGIPPTGYLEPGWQRLTGEKALWYGRSRHADDDFHRMDRQKCLLRDIVDQADPRTVVTHFGSLAEAARHTISTDLPAALLPALVRLAGTVKREERIRSLPFNPYELPGFHVYRPSVPLMRRLTAQALADAGRPAVPSRTPAAPSRVPAPEKTAATGAPVSLRDVCG